MTDKIKTEGLAPGRRTFVVAGKVKLPQGGLAQAEQNQTGTWLGVRTGFSVETSEGNLVYISLTGGRSLKNGLIQKPSKTGGEMVKIPFADVEKKEILDMVADYALKKANLESINRKDEKRFVCDIHYLEYLRDKLQDGQEVVVVGNVEYDDFKKDGETRVYRKLDAQEIRLNQWMPEKPATGDNDVIPAGWQTPHCAYINQTVLFDEDAVSKNVLKELKEEGRATISGYVPQYKSKVRNQDGKYEDWKKVVPIPLTFIYKAKGDDFDKQAQGLKKLFKLDKGKVWEQDVTLLIVEGYESGTIEEAEMDKELLDLIESGIIDKSDLKDRPVVRGTKRSELVYNGFILTTVDGVKKLGDKAKYTTDQLYAAIPNFETDEVEFTYEDDSTSFESVEAVDIIGDGIDDDFF